MKKFTQLGENAHNMFSYLKRTSEVKQEKITENWNGWIELPDDIAARELEISISTIPRIRKKLCKENLILSVVGNGRGHRTVYRIA